MCWIFTVGVYLLISTFVFSKGTKFDIGRQISIAAFDGPSAPNASETNLLFCEAARAHVKKLNDANEKDGGKKSKVTLTHLYLKGLSLAMHRVRGVIGRIQFGWY